MFNYRRICLQRHPISGLTGKIYFCRLLLSQLGILNPDDSITWTSAFSGNNFSTFGVNNQNELFVAAVNNGKIFKITSGTLYTGKYSFPTNKNLSQSRFKKSFIDGIKDKDISVEIFSADGKTVLQSQKVEKNKGIDISGIPAGVYFINLNSENLKYYSQKLIIQ
jgi:hypothetical protein